MLRHYFRMALRGFAAVVIFRQISFVRTLDFGFDRFNMLVVPSIGNIPLETRERLARVLRTGPGIAGTALSDAVPFDLFAAGSRSLRLDGRGQMQDALLLEMSPEFPSLFGMHLLAVRLLSATRGSDMAADWANKSVLINAAAAGRFGISVQAYRIYLSPLYFVAAGGAALLIAWATVYANTLRLARASPVHALRYE